MRGSACWCSRRRPASATTRSTRASPRSGPRAATSSRSTRPRTRARSATGAGPLRHRGLPVDDGRSLERPAGRLRALHPRGGGFAGIHAAADTEYDLELVRPPGRRLLPEPPGRDARRDGRCRGPHEPVDRAPAARWERTDEWYNYRSPDFADPDVPDGDYSPRERRRPRARHDGRDDLRRGGRQRTDDDHPIAWCQPYDGGRSWYTGMGHTAASYTEPDFVEHLLGGIEITAGAASSAECTNGARRPGRGRPADRQRAAHRQLHIVGQRSGGSDARLRLGLRRRREGARPARPHVPDSRAPTWRRSR